MSCSRLKLSTTIPPAWNYPSVLTDGRIRQITERFSGASEAAGTAIITTPMTERIKDGQRWGDTSRAVSQRHTGEAPWSRRRSFPAAVFASRPTRRDGGKGGRCCWRRHLEGRPKGHRDGRKRRRKRDSLSLRRNTLSEQPWRRAAHDQLTFLRFFRSASTAELGAGRNSRYITFSSLSGTRLRKSITSLFGITSGLRSFLVNLFTPQAMRT